MTRLALIVALTGACGRVHFDPVGGSGTGTDGPGGPGSCVDVVGLDWAAWPIPEFAGSGRHPTSYEVSADQLTVRDNVTGLIWQRAVDPGTYSYDQARAYCADLVLGGCEHWRLPERIELVSIVDYTLANPAIDPMAFAGTPSAPFWSATTYGSMFGWVVASGSGVWDIYDQTLSLRVRCVN